MVHCNAYERKLETRISKSTRALAIAYCLLAIGYWLLAIGYWLLAIGYWLLNDKPLREFRSIGNGQLSVLQSTVFPE
jgi:hypothetical protein